MVLKVGTYGPMTLSVCENVKSGTIANMALLGHAVMDTATVAFEEACVKTVVDTLIGCSGIFEETVHVAVPSAVEEVVRTIGLNSDTNGGYYTGRRCWGLWDCDMAR